MVLGGVVVAEVEHCESSFAIGPCHELGVEPSRGSSDRLRASGLVEGASSFGAPAAC